MEQTTDSNNTTENGAESHVFKAVLAHIANGRSIRWACGAVGLDYDEVCAYLADKGHKAYENALCVRVFKFTEMLEKAQRDGDTGNSALAKQRLACRADEDKGLLRNASLAGIQRAALQGVVSCKEAQAYVTLQEAIDAPSIRELRRRMDELEKEHK